MKHEARPRLKQRHKEYRDALCDTTVEGEDILLHNHPRDVLDQIMCPKVLPDTEGSLESRCMKCALRRCKDCPKFAINKEESSNDIRDNIRFHCHEYWSNCPLHFRVAPIPEHKTKCPICEENRSNYVKAEAEAKKKVPYVPVPVPEYGKCQRKKKLTLKDLPIGEFMNDYYLKALEEYAYHLFHVIWLGKDFCGEQREQAFRRYQYWFLSHADYAERFMSDPEFQAQGEHFGSHRSVSMEGRTLEYIRHSTGKIEFHFHSFLTEEKRQDSRTTHVHMHELLDELQKAGKIAPGDTTFLDLVDGCGKQYRSGTALFFLSILATTYQIVIDRMVTAPGHGKGKIDGLNAVDKRLLAQVMCRYLTPEVLEEIGYAMPTEEVSCVKKEDDEVDVEMVSFAKICYDILVDPERAHGATGDRKNAKREEDARLTERHYHLIDYLAKDTKLDLEHANYVAIGFDLPAKINGILNHYNFRADWELGVGKVAVRRIPCACKKCLDQLDLEWEFGIPPEEQPRYGPSIDCQYREVLGDINNWRIIDLVKGEKADEEEVETLFESVLQDMDAMMVQDINEGEVSAICTWDDETEGYYLVKWTENPVMAEEEMTLEDGTVVKEGQYLCKGIYLYEVPGGRHWYTEKDVTGGVQVNLPVDIGVRYVVLPFVDLEIEDGVDIKLPNSMRNHIKAKARHANCKHITDECHKEIKRMIDRRERLENIVEEGKQKLTEEQEVAVQEADIGSEEEGKDDSSEDEEDESD